MKPAMKPILVLYATREGHTHGIAEHIATTLRARGRACEVRDVSRLLEPLTLEAFESAILAASIHLGKHENEMVAFVRRHREELDRIPAAFLSVSLTEATVEDETRPQAERARADADVHKALDTFFAETGWHPSRAKPIAGALLYTKYGVLVRFVMKMIAKRAGQATDTSRDYVYTDWKGLDRFVDEITGRVATDSASAQSPGAPPR
jgi:menaquinone-dependent protoporphyrinogen oxidase